MVFTAEEKKQRRNAYRREYYKKNKELENAKSFLYSIDNREYLKTQYDCELCGGTYTNQTKSNHMKSKKHLLCLNISIVDDFLNTFGEEIDEMG